MVANTDALVASDEHWWRDFVFVPYQSACLTTLIAGRCFRYPRSPEPAADDTLAQPSVAQAPSCVDATLPHMRQVAIACRSGDRKSSPAKCGISSVEKTAQES